MDANTTEPDVAQLQNDELLQKADLNETTKAESETEERLDEPISDDISMDEDKGDIDNSNAKKMEEMDTLCEQTNSETKPVDDQKLDSDDKSEEKVPEKDNDEKDYEVPERQLRNSVKIDKPVVQEKEKSPSIDEEDKKPGEKQSETPKERKRRYKNFSSSPTKTTADEVVIKSKRKRLQSDKFCWRCHKESVEMQCSACPRSWHRKCIGGAPAESVENWICGECAAILKAENVESRSVTMAHVTMDQLCMMLKHVVERLREYPGSEPFWKAVDVNEVNNYLDYVVKPMDLSLLESNVRSKLYGSTDAFMADAKWIQHNCIVFNTCGGVYADTLKLTNVAKQMIKVARQEVSEMEACPDCYAHGRNLPRPMQSWFIEPCQRPHTLVWARLKGFPFWPAKAMPRINAQGQVDVRFFGQHDRAWVSPKEVFLYSREPPTQSRKRRADLENCVKEIERHCQKLAMVFGEFTFAPPKTQYNPQDADQIKLLLPHYDPSQPASKLMGAAMRKRSIANKKGSPIKKKSESQLDEGTPKKLKIDNNKEEDNSEVETPTTLSEKRRNGFFSEKNSEGKPMNNHPKKLSAILPSRISKRRFTTSPKSTPEKTKSKETKEAKDPLEVKKSPAKLVPPITIIKNQVKNTTEVTPVLSPTKVNVGLPPSQPLLFFVVNSDKNAVKVSSPKVGNSPKTSSLAVKTPTTVALPTIKQEPKSLNTSIDSPTPEESKKEGKARKTFAKKAPNIPDRVPSVENNRSGNFQTTPMVVIPNSSLYPESISNNQSVIKTYELPPPEAGPLSANLNKGAQELLRKLGQILEESLNNIAHDNSVNSSRATIHSLQMKIEKLKWLHQEEITEIKHNYERKIKEMQSSLEAETQRIIEENQKNADEKLRRSIDETKKKQWCALCGQEANFYCCWNTSYCDIPCQQAHWRIHMSNCTQPAFQTIETNSPEQIMPKLLVKNCISSA